VTSLGLYINLHNLHSSFEEVVVVGKSLSKFLRIPSWFNQR